MALARIVTPVLYTLEALSPPGPFPRMVYAELVWQQSMKLMDRRCLLATATVATFRLHPELTDGMTALNTEEMTPGPRFSARVTVPDTLILQLIGAPLLLVQNLVGVQDSLTLMDSLLLPMAPVEVVSPVSLLLPPTASILQLMAAPPVPELSPVLLELAALYVVMENTTVVSSVRVVNDPNPNDTAGLFLTSPLLIEWQLFTR